MRATFFFREPGCILTTGERFCSIPGLPVWRLAPGLPCLGDTGGTCLVVGTEGNSSPG